MNQKKHSESEFDLSSGLWVLHATQVVPHCRHFSLTRLCEPKFTHQIAPRSTYTNVTSDKHTTHKITKERVLPKELLNEHITKEYVHRNIHEHVSMHGTQQKE